MTYGMNEIYVVVNRNELVKLVIHVLTTLKEKNKIKGRNKNNLTYRKT